MPLTLPQRNTLERLREQFVLIRRRGTAISCIYFECPRGESKGDNGGLLHPAYANASMLIRQDNPYLIEVTPPRTASLRHPVSTAYFQPPSDAWIAWNASIYHEQQSTGAERIRRRHLAPQCKDEITRLLADTYEMFPEEYRQVTDGTGSLQSLSPKWENCLSVIFSLTWPRRPNAVFNPSEIVEWPYLPDGETANPDSDPTVRNFYFPISLEDAVSIIDNRRDNPHQADASLDVFGGTPLTALPNLFVFVPDVVENIIHMIDHIFEGNAPPSIFGYTKRDVWLRKQKGPDAGAHAPSWASVIEDWNGLPPERREQIDPVNCAPIDVSPNPSKKEDWAKALRRVADTLGRKLKKIPYAEHIE